MPRYPALIATALLGACALPAPAAEDVAAAPPGGNYQKVSDLVALPEFIPGLGVLYVDPATLPAGPFLAYDQGGTLMSTVYMVPLEDLQAQESFEQLAVGPGDVDHVDLHYNAGHPGVEVPHYHIVLWHVPPEEAERLQAGQ